MFERTVTSRRTVMAALAGATGLGAGLTAVAQERIRLTMVTAWPKGVPGVGVNAQRFADGLGVMSGGRLEVQLLAAGELAG